MRQVIVVILANVILVLFCSAQQYQTELERIKRQNQYEISKIDENTLKLKHKLYGKTKVVHIADQNISLKKLSGDMQIFDLINTPDSLYQHKYKFETTLDVCGTLGYPLVIGDFNNNGLIDIAGEYKIHFDYELAESAIVEQQEDGNFTLQHIFTDSVIIPLAVTDMDGDGLNELNISGSGGTRSLIMKVPCWIYCQTL